MLKGVAIHFAAPAITSIKKESPDRTTFDLVSRSFIFFRSILIVVAVLLFPLIPLFDLFFGSFCFLHFFAIVVTVTSASFFIFFKTPLPEPYFKNFLENIIDHQWMYKSEEKEILRRFIKRYGDNPPTPSKIWRVALELKALDESDPSI